MQKAYISDSTNLNGFVFDFIFNFSVSQNSTVSAYTLEDGSLISDHRSIAGLEISLSGMVSDAKQVFVQTFSLPEQLKPLDSVLGSFPRYAKALEQVQLYTKLFNSVYSDFNSILRKTSNSKITKIKHLLEIFSSEEQNLKLTCELGKYENLVLLSYTLNMDDDGNYQVDLKLKQVKTAKTKFAKLTAMLPLGNSNVKKLDLSNSSATKSSNQQPASAGASGQADASSDSSSKSRDYSLTSWLKEYNDKHEEELNE